MNKCDNSSYEKLIISNFKHQSNSTYDWILHSQWHPPPTNPPPQHFHNGYIIMCLGIVPILCSHDPLPFFWHLCYSITTSFVLNDPFFISVYPMTLFFNKCFPINELFFNKIKSSPIMDYEMAFVLWYDRFYESLLTTICTHSDHWLHHWSLILFYPFLEISCQMTLIFQLVILLGQFHM